MGKKPNNMFTVYNAHPSYFDTTGIKIAKCRYTWFQYEINESPDKQYGVLNILNNELCI